MRARVKVSARLSRTRPSTNWTRRYRASERASEFPLLFCARCSRLTLCVQIARRRLFRSRSRSSAATCCLSVRLSEQASALRLQVAACARWPTLVSMRMPEDEIKSAKDDLRLTFSGCRIRTLLRMRDTVRLERTRPCAAEGSLLSASGEFYCAHRSRSE